MRKTIASILIMSMMVLLLSACGKSAGREEQSLHLRIIDGAGTGSLILAGDQVYQLPTEGLEITVAGKKGSLEDLTNGMMVDVAYQRFNEAKNNLVECEKIDSRYVGTTIARLCYLLNAAMYHAGSGQEKRNMFSQIKKYYAALCAEGSKPSEEEQILYEFLDSSEAIGVLILVYDTLGAAERLETIYPLFRPDEVYSLHLNANLLRFMLAHQKYDIADKIVGNYDNIDKKSALLLLLPLLVILSQHCLLMVVEGIFLGMLLYGLKPLHIDASEEHGEAQVLVAYISHLFQELLILFVALQFHLSHL